MTLRNRANALGLPRGTLPGNNRNKTQNESLNNINNDTNFLRLNRYANRAQLKNNRNKLQQQKKEINKEIISTTKKGEEQLNEIKKNIRQMEKHYKNTRTNIKGEIKELQKVRVDYNRQMRQKTINVGRTQKGFMSKKILPGVRKMKNRTTRLFGY